MARVHAPWRRVVLGLAIALPIALVAAEVTLRLVGFHLPASVHVGDRQNRISLYYEPDPVLGWRLLPGQIFWKPDPHGRRVEYRSDADGFRCGIESRAAEEAPLVAVAGDSFAFGWDVAHEEAFGTQLAERLGWRQRNVAIPGYGLDQAWLGVRGHALAWKPTLVVLALFLGDFERSRTAYREAEGFTKPRFVLRDGKLVQETPADAPGALVRWLEGTRLARFVDAGLRHAGRFVELGPWWSLNAAILTALREDCAAAGVPLVVLFVPDDRWRSFPALGRHMERMNVPYIDPIASCPSEPPHFYFEGTGRPEHLTAEGHRFLADLLETWCREHLVEPRRR